MLRRDHSEKGLRVSHDHAPGEAWLTQQQAIEEFGITRQTLWAWRKKHTICEARIHKSMPRVFNRNDLMAADEASTRRNPIMKNVI